MTVEEYSKIEEYLKIDRFPEYDKGGTFERNALNKIDDIKEIVIKSNLSKIHTHTEHERNEHGEETKKAYIIWDMNYWVYFERYLRLLFSLNNPKNDRDICLAYMGINQYNHFREYFKKSNINLSNTLDIAAHSEEMNIQFKTWSKICKSDSDYEMNEYAPQIKGCMDICKFFVLWHERHHHFFDRQPELLNEARKSARLTILKQKDFILSGYRKQYLNKPAAIEYFEFENIINKIINGETDLPEDLSTDAAASFMVLMSAAKTPLSISNICLCLDIIHNYSILINAFAKEVDKIIETGGLKEKEGKVFGKENTKQLVLRERLFTYILAEQSMDIFSHINESDVYARSYRTISCTPPRNNYFNYVLPYFTDYWGKEFILQIYAHNLHR
ncbi:MAG: hypothetical protein LBR70_02780 [Lactobacillaceae bacterium]|jgi:hypothetical protein|nr:hypothetical protein [Lactobacillaceae bacterium]